MPITCPVLFKPIEQDEFARIDYQVMRCAFESQNKLGRLCDEVIYENDLAARLETAGLGPVRTQVPLTVCYRDFAKTYRLDLVVRDCALYGLKTTSSFIGEHEAQLLNYLFQLGCRHGKLVNFRPAQVESRFVNSTLTPEKQRLFKTDLYRWHESDERTFLLRTSLLGMLEEWGIFLELALYTEALTSILGGEQEVLQKVPFTRDGISLGKQFFHLVSPEIAFRVTALTREIEAYEASLQALLSHSPLRAIHWINIARHQIQFVTLIK